VCRSFGWGETLLDYRNVLDVTGSTAVITSGAGGLGFEAATALAQYGASVILSDLDAEPLPAAVGRLKASGATASSIVLDEPSEIASAILYLASNDSNYVTGAILSIDGGYTAW
jgi:NAD(P)-dependent dehydrogenase (short-subunit alcohol dehydrogenase family)